MTPTAPPTPLLSRPFLFFLTFHLVSFPCHLFLILTSLQGISFSFRSFVFSLYYSSFCPLLLQSSIISVSVVLSMPLSLPDCVCLCLSLSVCLSISLCLSICLALSAILSYCVSLFHSFHLLYFTFPSILFSITHPTFHFSFHPRSFLIIFVALPYFSFFLLFLSLFFLSRTITPPSLRLLQILSNFIILSIPYLLSHFPFPFHSVASPFLLSRFN